MTNARRAAGLNIGHWTFGLRSSVFGLRSSVPSRSLGIGHSARLAPRLAQSLIVFASLAISALAFGQTAGGSFEKDLAALTSQPHRLAGTPQARAASAYVEARLREIGMDEIYVQRFAVPLCRQTECRLTAGGKDYPVYALRPNHLQGVVTGAEGLSARTLYAGDGRLESYPEFAQDRIVVLDFSAGDRWQPAFAMGAKAVIFIEQDEPAPSTLHHVNMPANLPRFYVQASVAEELGLRTGPRQVTLHASAQWEQLEGRSVIGVLRGTKPRFMVNNKVSIESDETIVLSAPLDSLSEVPELSPGARGAANCAALLALAQQLKADRPRRDIVLAFYDGEAADHAGATAFYGALYRNKGKHRLAETTLDERLEVLRAEQTAIRTMSEVLKAPDIFAAEMRNKPGQKTAVEWLRNEAKGKAGLLREELQLLRMEKQAEENRIRELRKGRTPTASAPFVACDTTSGGAASQPAELPSGHGTPAVPGAAGQADRLIEEAQARIEQLEARIAPLAKRDLGWSALERALNDQVSRPEVRAQYQEIVEFVQGLYRDRLDELDRHVRWSEDGLALYKALGDGRAYIVLHLALNLGDESGRWTFIHGQDSMAVHGTKDNFGQYARIFQAIRTEADSPASGLKLFEARPVGGGGTYDIRMFAPGLVAHAGAVAGFFGVPNLALMTPGDRRVRDGQPADLVSRADAAGKTVPVLKTQNLAAPLAEIGGVIRRLGETELMSLLSGIAPVALYTETDYANGKSTGASALMLLAGSAMADRPARGAFVAVTRRPAARVWDTLRAEITPPGFTPFPISKVETTGRFEVQPLSKDYYNFSLVVAGRLDKGGLIEYVSNAQSVNYGQPLTAAATQMFYTTSITVVGYGYDRGALATRALKAASTAPLSDDRSLICESRNLLTVYARRGTGSLKLFNSDGMVVLGNRPGDVNAAVIGSGLAMNPFDHWPINQLTAHDLLILNDYRLNRVLKANRILENSLEQLQVDALEIRQQAQGAATQPASLEGKAAASAAVSRRVYKPLLKVLNDLVVAVVLLLLLAMPFAYSIERLMIGTPHIYRQIMWFIFFFLITFAVLYMVNPAFRIAATPIIIFLAFAIILLSTLVIVIMSRKLQAEVRRMQGLGSTVHSSDVSRLGTMMAAVSMGISTMRRRPVRTLLTAVTVVLLTFTILTFASFTSSWGNRRTYAGPMSGPPRLLVRHPLWSRLEETVPEALAGFLGQRATVVPRYWVAQTAEETQDFKNASRTKALLLSDAGGQNIVGLSAMVGLDMRDVQRLADLREVLVGQPEGLEQNGIFLTPDVMQYLKLAPGQEVWLDGVRCVLAGTVDLKKVTTYRMLEGSSMLPVDYEASGGGSAATFSVKESVSLDELPEMESAQFITFSADRVALVSADLARRLGGRVSSIGIYANEGADIEKLGEQVATVTGLPTYMGSRGGVYRLFFTSLTEASGWRDLVIPVVLGGLIIFATMLGSVSDREKEIYAFSALGLAPPHVASLFFAEAGVYAVVGGMGGYLLGQIVARTLSYIWPNLPTMNYSSTNAIATVLVVMCTVLVSTIYPALKASRSANPGIQRAWRIPKPEGDLYDIVFPFTVSAYDITGVASFLKEHFDNYSDTTLGVFATSHVHLFRQADGMLGIQAQVALAPFDLGVSEKFALMAQPSEIPGIQEIRILLARASGTTGDWQRANRVFINELRKQLLIWRSLPPEVMDRYRQATLARLKDLPVEDLRPENFGASPLAAGAVA